MDLTVLKVLPEAELTNLPSMINFSWVGVGTCLKDLLARNMLGEKIVR